MKGTSRLPMATFALGPALLAPPAQAQGCVGRGVGPSRLNADCAGFGSCDKF